LQEPVKTVFSTEMNSSRLFKILSKTWRDRRKKALALAQAMKRVLVQAQAMKRALAQVMKAKI
jgi:hypothetical protein